MTTQPEALRLADALDDPRTVVFFDQRSKAAAELRRLVAEHEEDQRVIAVWRGRTQRAEAQRDALLEALRTLLFYANEPVMRLLDPDGSHRAMQRARAAIKAVEEGK